MIQNKIYFTFMISLFSTSVGANNCPPVDDFFRSVIRLASHLKNSDTYHPAIFGSQRFYVKCLHPKAKDAISTEEIGDISKIQVNFTKMNKEKKECEYELENEGLDDEAKRIILTETPPPEDQIRDPLSLENPDDHSALIKLSDYFKKYYEELNKYIPQPIFETCRESHARLKVGIPCPSHHKDDVYIAKDFRGDIMYHKPKIDPSFAPKGLILPKFHYLEPRRPIDKGIYEKYKR